MKRISMFFAVLVTAAAVAAVPAASAQTVHYVGAGSSAMWQGFEVAAVNDLANSILTTGSCASSGTCSVHHWTVKTSHSGGCGGTCAAGVDNRSTLIKPEYGNLWVVWICSTQANPCPAGGVTDIWTYLSVDSTVGDRLFLAQQTATQHSAFLQLATNINSTTPDNAVTPGILDFGAPLNGSAATCPSGFSANCDDTSLDSQVVSALGGSTGIVLTAGMTDIRPEDAKYATNRSLTTNVDTGAASNCCYALGYGASPGTTQVGQPIKSAISSATANPVQFSLPGYADPFNSSLTVPTTIKVIPVGEEPIVFLTNRSNTTTGLGQVCQGSACAAAPWNGSYYVSNVWDQHPWPPNGTPPAPTTRRPLGNLFSGYDCGTDNAAFQPTDTGNKTNPPSGSPIGITVWLREPLSGTMNTTEYSEFRRFGTLDGNGPTGNGLTAVKSQEENVNPNTGDNPLNKNCDTFGGVRERGIGTGEVVNGSGSTGGVLNTTDSIAYAFFSFGNVSKLATSTKYGYLQIDGIDPLFDDYENSTAEAGQPAVNGSLATYGEVPACNEATGVPVKCRTNDVWTTPDPICGGSIGCSYPHLRDGTYPAWSELRLLCDTNNTHCLVSSDPYGAEALVENLQFDIHNSNFGGVPDLLPFSEASSGALSFNPPFGDVGYVRQHFNYELSPSTLADPASLHQSNPQVHFKCYDTGSAVTDVPATDIPVQECGGDAGGMITASGAAVNDETSVSVTAVSSTGTYTYSIVDGPALNVGEFITISNLAPAKDNGNFVITSVSGSTFTTNNPSPMTATAQSGAGVAGVASLGLNGSTITGAVVVGDQTQVSITAVTKSGTNATYSYTVTSGPALGVGQTIVITNMTEAGNNGTFLITAVGSGTFTVVNNSAVADASETGNGVTASGSQQ